jgi:hypothetical protein
MSRLLQPGEIALRMIMKPAPAHIHDGLSFAVPDDRSIVRIRDFKGRSDRLRAEGHRAFCIAGLIAKLVEANESWCFRRNGNQRPQH